MDWILHSVLCTGIPNAYRNGREHCALACEAERLFPSIATTGRRIQAVLAQGERSGERLAKIVRHLPERPPPFSTVARNRFRLPGFTTQFRTISHYRRVLRECEDDMRYRTTTTTYQYQCTVLPR